MAALDKFARLAALRPAQSTTALRDDQPSPEESPSAGLDECTLVKLLGATIVRTKYGDHGTRRRNRDVCISDRNRVVGFGRLAARAVHDARFFGGALGAAGACRKNCGTSRAGDV